MWEKITFNLGKNTTFGSARKWWNIYESLSFPSFEGGENDYMKQEESVPIGGGGCRLGEKIQMDKLEKYISHKPKGLGFQLASHYFASRAAGTLLTQQLD